ncbi:MAG: ComEC/Rec2 family competence protein [Holosporales bacterium]|jgi:competence protein ComEC|nr:ComEC/Rec2 family competence protein [Holosporales bacterium]
MLKFLNAERERLPLFAPVIFGFGIIFGVFFPFTSWKILNYFIGISLVFCKVLFKKTKLGAVAFFLFSAGIYVAQTGGILETGLLTQKKFIDREYNGVTFLADVGFIEATHPVMKNMQRIVFKNIKVQNEDLDFIKTAKMTCSSKLIDKISSSDQVKVIGKFFQFKMASIPFSFDQAQYNALIKMDATGIVFFIKSITKSNFIGTDIFSNLRQILTKKIIKTMEGPAGGVASALLTGDKSPITSEIRDKFINSGTAHILAISGLHMSLVASVLFSIFFRISLCMRWFSKRINAKKVAAFLTILFTFLYLSISGFSPSATRAFIMTTICLIGIMFGRGVLSMRSVAIAAFLILLFDAGSLFLVSFQLSFCAVVALIAFYERYNNLYSKLRISNSKIPTILVFITMSTITTLIASIATFPVSAATFNRLSLSGILGNLVAIPMVSFAIIPIGIIAIVFGYFTDIFSKLLEIVLDMLIKSVGIISSLPGSNLVIKSPSILTLYLMVIGGIILCLFKSKARHVGSGLVCASSIMWVFEKGPDIIFPPQIKAACYAKDGEFYATSLRKGRSSIFGIQRNLGFAGEIQKKDLIMEGIELKTYDHGLYIWTQDGETVIQRKRLAERKHPYCPAHFESIPD